MFRVSVKVVVNICFKVDDSDKLPDCHRMSLGSSFITLFLIGAGDFLLANPVFVVRILVTRFRGNVRDIPIYTPIV